MWHLIANGPWGPPGGQTMRKAIRIGSAWTRTVWNVMVDAGYFAGAACAAFGGALLGERLLIALFG